MSQEPTEHQLKFSALDRLYGDHTAEKLRQSHVCVIGLGGVGSWAVEALVRSGIGEITLVDFDDVCVSNFNRQVQAIAGGVGRMKTEQLKQRALSIYSELKVHLVEEPFDKNSSLLEQPFDYVVDAIDNVKDKSFLLAQCLEKKQPVISVGGAGGRYRPELIEQADLRDVHGDALLRSVRNQLRKDYGLGKTSSKEKKKPNKFRIPCLFSSEEPRFPLEQIRQGPLDCSTGFGTAVFVTGAFGFQAASHVIRELALGEGG